MLNHRRLLFRIILSKGFSQRIEQNRVRPVTYHVAFISINHRYIFRPLLVGVRKPSIKRLLLNRRGKNKLDSLAPEIADNGVQNLLCIQVRTIVVLGNSLVNSVPAGDIRSLRLPPFLDLTMLTRV